MVNNELCTKFIWLYFIIMDIYRNWCTQILYNEVSNCYLYKKSSYYLWLIAILTITSLKIWWIQFSFVQYFHSHNFVKINCRKIALCNNFCMHADDSLTDIWCIFAKIFWYLTYFYTNEIFTFTTQNSHKMCIFVFTWFLLYYFKKLWQSRS